MKKRRFLHSRCFLLAVCAAVVLTGCSMGKKQENIDQGMEAIAQLEEAVDLLQSVVNELKALSEVE